MPLPQVYPNDPKIHLVSCTQLKLGVSNVRESTWSSCQFSGGTPNLLTRDIAEVTCRVCIKTYAREFNRPDLLVKMFEEDQARKKIFDEAFEEQFGRR